MIKTALLALSLPFLIHSAFATERGYLGVSFGALPSTEKVVKSGVIVKRIFPGMAGENQLQPGDIVIRINGVPVRDPETAVALLAENGAGERVWLTVVEKPAGKLTPSNIFVTMGNHPTDDFAKIMTAKPPRRLPHCGATVETRGRPCIANIAAEH